MQKTFNEIIQKYRNHMIPKDGNATEKAVMSAYKMKTRLIYKILKMIQN